MDSFNVFWLLVAGAMIGFGAAYAIQDRSPVCQMEMTQGEFDLFNEQF